MNYRAEFWDAVESGDLDTVKRLVETCLVNPQGSDSEAFCFAALNGHLEMVKFLLPHSDPTALDSQALRWAAANGHLEIVKLLLPHSNPKAKNSEAFRWAAKHGHLEVVKLLLPHTDPEVVRRFI